MVAFYILLPLLSGFVKVGAVSDWCQNGGQNRDTLLLNNFSNQHSKCISIEHRLAKLYTVCVGVQMQLPLCQL